MFISNYISLHILLSLTNSATDHLSNIKLQPISLPTQLHDRDSVYAHQLYLNRIRVTFIRLFQLPTIHHHLILLYRCFCFQIYLFTFCKERDKYHTRPPCLQYRCLNCRLQSLNVEMEPAALISASPHPPPPTPKDQIQCQLPKVRSSNGSHSLI